MKPEQVQKRIAEFARIHPDAGADEVSLLEAALYIEEVFGITLSDKEICEKNMGSQKAMKNFLLNKLELEHPCAESVES